MEIRSQKTITIELSEHEAFMLEQVLEQFKTLSKAVPDNAADPFEKYAGELLTVLSKEIVRKI